MNHYSDDMENRKSETVERPTLGCRPYYVTIAERIKDLAEAISWQAETQCNTDMINLWAHEIELQCEMLNKLQQHKND